MRRYVGPPLSACVLLAVACGGGSSRVGSQVATPDVVTPASLMSPTPFPSLVVPLTKCAQGDGWSRPSSEDQRAHLRSLGGEYARASDGGDPIAGSYVSRGAGQPSRWEYMVLWASLTTAGDRNYALAASGLWTAVPDAARVPCSLDPRRVVILVLDNEVISIHGEDRYTQLFEMVARPRPGHFEFLELDAPSVDRPIGFGITGEDGNVIASCCM